MTIANAPTLWENNMLSLCIDENRDYSGEPIVLGYPVVHFIKAEFNFFNVGTPPGMLSLCVYSIIIIKI